MSDLFYRTFEDKHRGTLQQIKHSQRVYLPFVQPLTLIYPNPQAIDLGCGRGEWLELAREAGFDAQGVDLDDGMLAECRKRGLKVRTLDAIAALKELPNESQTVVSGFHLAEHIPFETLQLLVKEALRVLKPAGLLILETPNPENIVVGTTNFYLDPTHNRPLPPLLLSFLPEYYGFGRVKVLRLQESITLTSDRRITIHDVLGGTSPDYAVVAQKDASTSILKNVSAAFDTDYGVTLQQAAGLFEKGIEQQSETKVNELDVKLNLTLQRVDREIRERLSGLDERINELTASLAPFIRIGNQIRLLRAQGLYGRTKAIFKKIIKGSLNRTNKFISARPKLKSILISISKKLGLYDRVVTASQKLPRRMSSNSLKQITDNNLNQALKDCPPAVRDVYSALEIEINKQEKR